jgi:Fic family protein
MPKYLHQHKNWPAYSYDLKALVSGLELANKKRGLLFGTLQAIGFDGLRQQELQAITDELVKSSAIEGEALNAEIVRDSVARRLGLDAGGVTGTDHYIEGLVEMAIDATTNHGQPLTKDRILNWHAALFPTGRNVFGKVLVGSWRDDSKGPMVVASQKSGREIIHFEAPAADRLNHEMNRFIKWFEASNEKSLTLKAGIAHLWFETIHPLDDGNGRVGRNLIDLMLSRADNRTYPCYSLSSQIHKERLAYYEILERTQKGHGDYTEWLAWFIGCLSNALDSALITVSEAMKRTRFWQKHQGVPFNDRQRKIVSRLLVKFDGRMTNSKYAKIAKCSDSTATRDLTDLVEKQILVTDGAGGRSTGYILRDFD